jgi:hypothetical protein
MMQSGVGVLCRMGIMAAGVVAGKTIAGATTGQVGSLHRGKRTNRFVAKRELTRRERKEICKIAMICTKQSNTKQSTYTTRIASQYASPFCRCCRKSSADFFGSWDVVGVGVFSSQKLGCHSIYGCVGEVPETRGQ